MIPSFVKLGAYFSLSPYFGHPRKAAQLETFAKVPLDRLLAETDLRDLIPAITQPVRLRHGGADKLMPVAAAEGLADTLPNARLSVFSDAGHAPFVSRAPECAALIESFALD